MPWKGWIEPALRLVGMDRQILRDWVHRYKAEGIAELCNQNEQREQKSQ